MTASQKRAQRETDPNAISPIDISVSPRIDGVRVHNTDSDNDPAHSRADSLDAEAAYYRHRAIQEEQALGPGYYVDLLRSMARDRATMAQRIRTHNAAT
jgi:hypothetical protein